MRHSVAEDLGLTLERRNLPYDYFGFHTCAFQTPFIRVREWWNKEWPPVGLIVGSGGEIKLSHVALSQISNSWSGSFTSHYPACENLLSPHLVEADGN